ncbi:adhesion G protein-coupled receptor L2 [Trichonephila clavata]|uniref:Adhesion G protein-coupled receptor L2 n=1 Tax=Trichonephila clavata TaxID=2740835 RepID=A0A8X6HEJ7_TRICU|nr:adhesion G protein-coupled receptor L2 [Trichonephila clavata]
MKITSGIIGVSLGDFNASYQLPENKTVKIILNHPPRFPGATPVCVFLNWNYSQTDSEYGIWDSTGCYVTRHELEFTECECNHLTNFAILMNFAGPEFKEKDNYALDILSLICCSISSVSLLLTVIIYLTVKSLRSRRNMITCNLAICLLAMNILVQTGLKRVATTVCQITSAVLQYCVLCAFFWMLLEGILLYKMVIMVFETKKVRSIFLYFTAYGIPFVIVTLSSAMYPDAMIRQRYCWPSKEKGLIWSVLGPVLLIIVVNLIIFIMTLNAAAKIDKINSTSLTCEGRKKNLKQRTKGMMSLTCLLGFTWATGFFSLSNQSFVAYLFVFLNGLQTSSVQPSKDSDGKNTEKEKNKTKFIKSENFVVSTVEQHYPLPTAPPSPPIGDDLLQIRLTIIERRKKPQELHPFSLNEDEV